jgi:1-deoxy-D-xylulose-5-phosphate reductoisomerase
LAREIRNIALLGASGSIGRSTLDIVARFPDRYRVVALGGGDNLEILAEQAARFRPRLVAVREESGAEKLRELLWQRGVEIPIQAGREGAVAVAIHPEAELLVAAMVGAVGLEPTHAALAAGRDVALANKESMVMAGRLLNQVAAASGARILPLDSEHSAIWQALNGEPRGGVAKLILTASGGPFREHSRDEMAKVTLEQALCHPRWEMGPKITIDSATMMNKALEIIEARWLFEIPPEKIEVVVHPQSIVHSLVEYIDGSVLAQLGLPDMRLPIAYALGAPERLELDLPKLSLAEIGRLEFFAADEERFPALQLVRRALALGDTGAIAFNAANEVAVDRFRSGEIGFLEIAAIVAGVLEQTEPAEFTTLDEIQNFDRRIRCDLENAPLGQANSNP